MLGLVHMRFAHGKKTRRKSYAKAEVKVFDGQNVVICSAARERNPAHSPPNTKIHALLLCTWQNHTKEVICEGRSQGVWRSKCCDLLGRIRTRLSSQCPFRRKKEMEFVRQVSLLSEINQQLKQEFGRIAMKKSCHVHVIQTFLAVP